MLTNILGNKDLIYSLEKKKTIEEIFEMTRYNLK